MKLGPHLPNFRSNFGQPDYGFDRLDLTEQWVDALDLAVPTPLEQPGRLGSNLPMVWVRKVTPGFHIGPDFIDDGLGRDSPDDSLVVADKA